MNLSTPWWVRSLVGMALPLVTRWAHRHQERILAEGRPLNREESAKARAIGIADVRRVRVLTVSTVPTPGSRILRFLAWLTRISPELAAGMALGHGIYLDREYGGSRLILLHELVHVAQYERMGGIRPFMRQYLAECLSDGYDNSGMEQEAARVAWQNYRSRGSEPEEETAGIT